LECQSKCSVVIAFERVTMTCEVVPNAYLSGIVLQTETDRGCCVFEIGQIEEVAIISLSVGMGD